MPPGRRLPVVATVGWGHGAAKVTVAEDALRLRLLVFPWGRRVVEREDVRFVTVERGRPRFGEREVVKATFPPGPGDDGPNLVTLFQIKADQGISDALEQAGWPVIERPAGPSAAS